MASPAARPSANGTDSSDLPDNIMVDGRELPELSIPSPSLNSTDQKTFDWNGNVDGLSPSSSTSTSTIGSPIPSSAHLTRRKSKAMKPRKSQSAYFDEELGLWKCRNCGGTYDVSNPGSRQRREHKKACEETQRLKALRGPLAEEQARRSARAAAALLHEEGSEGTSNNQNIPGKKSTDHLLQNGHARTNITDSPSIIGTLNATPDIPEIEEVNFGAPKELVHSGEIQAQESDAEGQLNETQKADAKSQSESIDDQKTKPREDGAQLYEKENAKPQSENIDGQKTRPGEDGAQPYEKEHSTTRSSEEGDFPSEQDHLAEDDDFGDAPRTPLRTEHLEEPKLTNDSSRNTSREVFPKGGPHHNWDDNATPPRRTKLLDEFEHVKYCSTATSEEAHLAGTLYDQLVDVHDDAAEAPIVSRSVSLGHGLDEAARITSLKHETSEALGKNFGRAVSVDHFVVDLALRKDHHHSTRVSRLGRGAEESSRKEHSRDASPDDLIQALVGRDLSGKASIRTIRNTDAVTTPQNRSKASVRSIGDSKITNVRTPGSPSGSTRAQFYSPRASGTLVEQSGSPAVASTSKQPQSQRKPQRRGQRAGASSGNQSESRQGDDNFGAMVVRNLGKFWVHIASVGAVAVIAWVGKSLAEQHQPSPRRRAPEIRHFTVNSFYWDE